MPLLYRLLGLAAQFGALLSRRRINLITSSVLPLFGFGFAFYFAVVAVLSLQEGSRPHTVPLKDLNKEFYTGRRFLSVRGRYLPSVAYELKGKDVDRGFVPRNYVGFIDADKTGVILVAASNDVALPEGEVTLIGIADNLPIGLSSSMPQEELGLPIVQRFYLQPGATPKSPGVAAMECLLVAVPSTIYLLAFTQLYVIFRRGDALTVVRSAPAPPNMPTLFATSRFYLQQHGSERFLEVPATLNVLPSGEIALYALADASHRSSFYMIPTTTEQRVGYWASIIAPGSVQKLESGLQYLGLSSRWALRFSYLDAISHRRETMVLAFADEELRRQVRAELEKLR